MNESTFELPRTDEEIVEYIMSTLFPNKYNEKEQEPKAYNPFTGTAMVQKNYGGNRLKTSVYNRIKEYYTKLLWPITEEASKEALEKASNKEASKEALEETSNKEALEEVSKDNSMQETGQYKMPEYKPLLIKNGYKLPDPIKLGKPLSMEIKSKYTVIPEASSSNDFTQETTEYKMPEYKPLATNFMKPEIMSEDNMKENINILETYKKIVELTTKVNILTTDIKAKGEALEDIFDAYQRLRRTFVNKTTLEKIEELLDTIIREELLEEQLGMYYNNIKRLSQEIREQSANLNMVKMLLSAYDDFSRYIKMEHNVNPACISAPKMPTKITRLSSSLTNKESFFGDVDPWFMKKKKNEY